MPEAERKAALIAELGLELVDCPRHNGELCRVCAGLGQILRLKGDASA